MVQVPAGSTGPTPIAGGSGLFAPYGIALKDGNAYVTTNSVLANTGEVIRIKL